MSTSARKPARACAAKQALHWHMDMLNRANAQVALAGKSSVLTVLRKYVHWNRS